MVSNDALHIVSSGDRNKSKECVRRDELMAVSQLHRTPAYSGDPITVTLENGHLAADGHSIGFR